MSESEPSTASIYLPVGTLIGEFRVEQLLGEGGMATVYAATHSVIGKKAAVKVMSHRLCADPAAVERFLSEARAVNQIGHPNIVDAFAFGKLDDGRSYMVMEWLQGETLQQRLERESIPIGESLHILAQICDALEAAHEKGIIHRDLKPDNIFLMVVRGKRTVVKLLDFGIAKLSGGDLSTSKTKTGLFVGTPTHISPEQARAKPIDGRTDVYALGVTAFQMLTGRLPFDADNAMDLVTMHLQQAPPQPSSIWPQIPSSIEGMLLAMLEKDAANRPTLAEVSALIELLREEYRTPAPFSSPDFASLSSRITPLPVLTPDQPQAIGAMRTPPHPAARHASGDSRPVVNPFQVTAPAGTPVKEPRPTPAPQPLPATDMAAVALHPAAPLVGKKKTPAWIFGAVVIGSIGVLTLALRTKPTTTSTAQTPAPAPSAAAAPVPAAPVVAEPRSPTPPAPAPAELGLQINVPAQVELDGDIVAEQAQSVRIPVPVAGAHQLVVTAPKWKPHYATVRTTPGEKVWLNLSLERATPSEPRAADKRTEPKRANKPAATSREYMLDPFAAQK